MKQLIILAFLCMTVAACGKKAEEKPELTAEQELQVVDSATMETKARIDSLGKSIEDLESEVDSILNNNN